MRKNNYDIKKLIFAASDKGFRIKRDHPEIANTQEFKDLSHHDLKFVWLYTVYYNPINNKLVHDERRRVQDALYYAYEDRKSEKDKAKYIAGNFPPHIRTAIKKMETYDLPSRLKARFMIEHTLSVYQDLLMVSTKDFEGDDEWDRKKQYVDMSAKVIPLIPQLIKQLEQGFGFKEMSYDVEEGNLISTFHDELTESNK